MSVQLQKTVKHGASEDISDQLEKEMILVSGKLPTYPSPQPNINSNFSICAKCCLRGGVGGKRIMILI